MTSQESLSALGVRIDVAARTLFGSVDFSLRGGECILLRGRSGSGKSTLLRTIAGLRDPTSGTILHDQRDAESWGWPQWRRKVHLVENRFPLGRSTVMHAFERALLCPADPIQIDRDAIEKTLGSMDLPANLLPRTAASLSEGERQRARLVRALLIAPPVLLLDEPTNALDPESRARVFDALRGYRAQGGAVLLVTHDPPAESVFAARSIDVGSFR